MEQIIQSLSEPINQLITLGVMVALYALAYSGRVFAGKRRTTKQKVTWSWQRFWDDLSFRLGIGYAMIIAVVCIDAAQWILPATGWGIPTNLANILNANVIISLPFIAALNEIQKTVRLLFTVWKYQENLETLGMSESDFDVSKANPDQIAESVKKALGDIVSLYVKQDNDDVEAGSLVKEEEGGTLAELGAYPYYRLPCATPSEFYNAALGLGFNEGFGLQCVAAFKEFMVSLCGSYVAAGGAASNYASAAVRAKVEALGFTWHDGSEGLQDGDWGIWVSGVYGHVSMRYQGKWFGQNQGAKDGNIGTPFNLMSLPLDGFAGYFRPNIYSQSASKTETEGKPATIKPSSSREIEKGDRVKVLNHVDVKGTRLQNLQADYLVYQVRKSDRTAVLKTDDGDIYARMSFDDIS